MAVATVNIDPATVYIMQGCVSVTVDLRRSVTDTRSATFAQARYAVITCYDGLNATGNVIGTSALDSVDLFSAHGAAAAEVLRGFFQP